MARVLKMAREKIFLAHGIHWRTNFFPTNIMQTRSGEKLLVA
jgi:hypothetical protein